MSDTKRALVDDAMDQMGSFFSRKEAERLVERLLARIALADDATIEAVAFEIRALTGHKQQALIVARAALAAAMRAVGGGQ